jgi:predicted transcriptional regulator of viral defense system
MMRTSELAARGVAATTLQRLLDQGRIARLSRGLYQLATAPIDTNHDLAEAAKRIPKGVICLVSALAYHELTDQLPHKVWMAIGLSNWAPVEHGLPLHLVRMSSNLLHSDVETHRVENVEVKVFGAARTIMDCFRHRKSVGLPVAVEALREALRQRKATPADLARMAQTRNVWPLVSPYLEVFSLDG